MAEAAVGVERMEDGAIWLVEFGADKGNILDAATMGALHDVFDRAATARELKAICLRGRGEHFSFGASVAEHLPERVRDMLRAFHGLFYRMLDAAVPTLAAVRGRCLGGGLELAAFCHRVFAAPDAKLGQPEIALGVFAPVASVYLAERTGRAAAEDLCLTGRVVDADEALALGLVDAIAPDPTEAALAYAREHFLPRSAASLRYAVAAARHGLKRRFAEELQAVERLYLDELMLTEDAVEGLRAFLEKRPPAWRNR